MDNVVRLITYRNCEPNLLIITERLRDMMEIYGKEYILQCWLINSNNEVNRHFDNLEAMFDYDQLHEAMDILYPVYKKVG